LEVEAKFKPAKERIGLAKTTLDEIKQEVAPLLKKLDLLKPMIKKLSLNLDDASDDVSKVKAQFDEVTALEKRLEEFSNKKATIDKKLNSTLELASKSFDEAKRLWNPK
jgi:chromosome segregation ATPase